MEELCFILAFIRLLAKMPVRCNGRKKSYQMLIENKV
jgi:hypothetical protein